VIGKDIKGVKLHTVSGPHPAGCSSVHIHHIAPIQHPEDYVWTLSALDVAIIGKMAREGRYLIDREIAIAGNGVKEEKRGFIRGRIGYPIGELAADRVAASSPCFLSGDPLTGFQLQKSDYLRFADTCFTILPKTTQRESFHFLRLGGHKYSATRAYLPAEGEDTQKGCPFTTNQHGESRPFIDGDVYEKVMPMRIPTMQLIKAILVEDYDLAEQLGLLEVIPEDFVLPTFISPSKIEMVDIVQHGLRRYAKEMGH
jgi:Na+-transporting NADH:ubiquinone oxidoreductase subunit A